MDKSCPFKWEKLAKCIDGFDQEKTKIAWIKASHKMSLFTRPIFKGFAHTNQLFDSEFANEKKKVSRTRNQKAKQELIALADAEAENHASLENDYDQNDGQMGTKAIDKIIKSLNQKFQENEKVHYLRYVLDGREDKGFAHTIENIFHISFLVKKDTVGIEFDRYDQPYLFKPRLSKSFCLYLLFYPKSYECSVFWSVDDLYDRGGWFGRFEDFKFLKYMG